MKIDPRSADVALHYTGTDAGEPAISGVPARDLTENDVARLVYVQHGEIHGAAHQNAVEKLVDELTQGPYRRTPEPPKKSKSKPKSPAAPVPQPVAAPDEPASAEPSVDSTEGEV